MNKILFKRIYATIIDYVLICIILFVYPSLFGEEDEGVYRMQGVAVYFPFIIGFFYLVFMEYLFGATIGYKIFGLKVMAITMRRYTLVQALKRRLADIVDIQLSIGLIAFFFILSTRHHQRLGDLWARTIVVDNNADNYTYFLQTEFSENE